MAANKPSLPIRVGLLGLGPIGLEVARRVATSADLRLDAAADSAASLAGRRLGELAPGTADVSVHESLEAMLDAAAPEAVFVCTGSRLEAIRCDLEVLLGRGISVVSSAEELACPAGTHPKLAADLDRLAASRGARLLGTGVNPGFLMDALPVFMAQASGSIRRIEARRVVDTRRRRAPLRRKTGCGLDPEAFRAGVERGALGHMGFEGSARLVAQGLGRELRFDEELEPVLTTHPLETPEGCLPSGVVAGIHQVIRGSDADEPVLLLDLTMAAGSPDPHDALLIEGEPRISLRLEGGLDGDAATARRLVNSVRPLLETAPGLRTVLDLPLAAGP